MKIIKIEPYENGAHANQTSSSTFPVPDGYALIPDNMLIPDTFPFVDIEVEGDNPPIVAKMTAGVVPPTPEPSVDERVAELKANLSATDYQAIKYAEGWISEAEYAPIKAERQLWRDEINRLEKGE